MIDCETAEAYYATLRVMGTHQYDDKLYEHAVFCPNKVPRSPDLCVGTRKQRATTTGGTQGMSTSTKIKLWLVLVIIMAAIAIDDTGPEIGTAMTCEVDAVPQCQETP